jgi:hypothetical protein
MPGGVIVRVIINVNEMAGGERERLSLLRPNLVMHLSLFELAISSVLGGSNEQVMSVGLV